MSINVCSPLKRAKSTVGEPLVNCTVLPLESLAEMLICTLKEMTLAIGASVPTTKDEPVTVCVLLVGVEEVELLPQPVARRVATVNATRDGRASLPDFEIDIPISPRFLRRPVASRGVRWWDHSIITNLVVAVFLMCGTRDGGRKLRNS